MRGFASGYVHDDWPERQRGAMTHFLPPLLSSIFNFLLFLNHLTVHSKWNNTCSLQLAHQVCDLKLTWYYTFLLPDSKKHNVNVLMAASIFYTQCRAWGEIKECELMHIWTDVYYCTSIKRYVTRCSLNTGELCVFLLTTLTGLNQFRCFFSPSYSKGHSACSGETLSMLYLYNTLLTSQHLLECLWYATFPWKETRPLILRTTTQKEIKWR